MKKVLAIITVLILSLALLAGCSNEPTDTTGNDPGTDTPEPAGETYKIVLITMDQMDQHWNTVNEGCLKAVSELGNVDYSWMAPDVKDDAKQIEIINNAVASGADCILLAANGPTAVQSALEDAAAAGVAIVYVDSPADFDAAKTLATDNKAAGKTAGEELKKALEADGITSGKIGIISVNTSTNSTVLRVEGFQSAFEGTDFELLEVQYGEGDAARSQQLAENFITQGVVGMFGANEGSTVGVGNAIKEDGNKISGVGFDKSDTILGLIEEGSLVCTMAQNPDVMGYEGMKTAVGVLSGTIQADGAVVDTGVSVLN